MESVAPERETRRRFLLRTGAGPFANVGMIRISDTVSDNQAIVVSDTSSRRAGSRADLADIHKGSTPSFLSILSTSLAAA
jgi:hypothetical protein